MVRVARILFFLFVALGIFPCAHADFTTDSLVGYYRFEERIGREVVDSAPGQLRGELLGNPLWIHGKVGSAMSFDGVYDLVSVNDTAAPLNLGPNSWTVAFWLKLAPDSPGDHNPLIGKRSAVGNGWQVRLMNRPVSGHMRKTISFSVVDSVGAKTLAGKQYVDDDLWHHVAVVLDRRSESQKPLVQIFIDGVLDASLEGVLGEPLPAGSTLQIGGSLELRSRAKVTLDSLRIYRRAFSPAEIVTLVSAENQSAIPPIVSVTAPLTNQTLNGTVTVEAIATSPHSSIKSVRFMLSDGTGIGLPDTTEPYQVSWDSRLVPNGTRQITAIATDALNNSAPAPAIPVTIGNSSPVAQVKTVSTYQALGSTWGSPGQPVTLQSPTAPSLDGTFDYSVTEPPGGVDGGIVLQGANGWWVRRVASTLSEPIELDWFQFAEGANITQRLRLLATRYGPKFYVRMPSVNRTLISDYIDFSTLNLSEVGLLEAANAKTVLKLGIGGGVWTGPTGKGHSMMKFGALTLFIIGSPTRKPERSNYNLTLQGDFGLHDHMWYDDRNEVWNNSDALVEVSLPNSVKAGIALVRATIKDSWASGLAFGCAGKSEYSFDKLSLGGTFDNAAVRSLNGAIREIELENAYFSDPYGIATGWDPEKEPSMSSANCSAAQLATNPTLKCSNCDWDGVPQDGDAPRFAYGQPVAGFFLADKLAGEAVFQYGGSGIGFFHTKVVGNGEDHPLLIRYMDKYFTKSGVEILCENNGGITKYDGIGEPEKVGQRFVHYVHEQGQYGRGRGFETELLVESSPNWSPPTLVQTSNIVFTLTNLLGRLSIGSEPVPGYGSTHHLTFQGDGVHPAMYMVNDTIPPMVPWSGLNLRADDSVIRDGQFGSIMLANNTSNTRGDHLLTNVSLRGRVTVGYYLGDVLSTLGPKTVRLNKVTWLEDPSVDRKGVIMKIGPGSTVYADNIWAKVGSIIQAGIGSAQTAGVEPGSLYLNGKKVVLPYAIQASDLGERLPDIPKLPRPAPPLQLKVSSGNS